MKKNPTSVRLTEGNESKLKAISKRDGTTISQSINKIIDSFSAEREDKLLPSSGINELMKRLDTIEKELSLQRQRINIFKNQVDFIVKSQNGKLKSDKYSGVNKSKQSLAEYSK